MIRNRVIILLLLISSMAIAQTQKEKPFLKFKNISGNLGLPGEFARCIIQDKLGFMWFGTDIGFKYFDGYSYKEYFLNKDDIIVTAMTEDQNGNIWAFAGADGVYKLDRKMDVLTRYQVGLDTFVALGQIYPLLYKSKCLFYDKNGTFWVGTHKGFYSFDSTTQKFNIPHQPHKNYTSWVFKDKKNDYLEVLNNGIRLFNSKDSTILPFQDGQSKPKSITGQISHVLEDKAGIIWIAVLNEGLYRFDKPTRILTHFRNEPNNPFSLSFDNIGHTLEDSKGRFWIAADDGGLDFLDRATNRFYHYQANFRDVDIPNAKPYFLFEDNAQGLWVSHYHGGIHYIANNTKPFKNYAAYANDSKSLSNPYINSFCEGADGNIWVSTDGGGVNLWDRKQGIFKHYKYNPQNSSNSLNTNKGGTIIEDNYGYVWLNTGMGLNQIDIKNNAVKHFPYSSLYKDRKGGMWFAQKGGLHKFDYNKQTFVLTIPDNNYLFEDSKGNDWVRKESGLYRYDFNTKKLVDGIQVKFNTLSEDSKGNFWIALSPQSDTLLKYNPVNKVFLDTLILKNAQDHLYNRMTIDNKDNVWLGTKNGLYRYDPFSKILKHYDYNDGLVSNFYRFANPIKTRNGELLFGSNKGFTIFHPDSLKDNTLMPIVHITSISLDNKELFLAGSAGDTLPQKSPLKQHILFTDKIILTHLQNNLSFGFAALNYDTPEKNQYKYKLEGYDKDWINTPASARIAKYTNLSHGHYTFRVIASNNDGVWNEEGAFLKIIINPPWWQTWWAYGNYMLLLAFAGWRVHLDQKKRTIKKERERAQARELAQAKEIEKAYRELKSTQTQLIQKEKMASLGELTAGIAHEIQNPLNFVNNFSELSVDLAKELNEEMDKDAIDKAFVKDLVNDLTSNQEKINHHGKRASNIVKGMLEHSRTSTGVKELTDVNKLVDESLRLSYHSLKAKDKNFNAHFNMDFDETITKISLIPPDIGRVLINLFNNAFYAVHQKSLQGFENYTPSVSVSTKQVGSNIEIKVIDNGNGIPENIRQKIFQPFFTTKPTGEGTGLGLSLSYEIVVKGHGGSLEVQSTVANPEPRVLEGKGVDLPTGEAGSEFIIQLPITE